MSVPPCFHATGHWQLAIKVSVGADASVRPPAMHHTPCKKLSLRSQCAHWLWQSATPVPLAPLPKGGWHGEAVTGGFHTSPHLL